MSMPHECRCEVCGGSMWGHGPNSVDPADRQDIINELIQKVRQSLETPEGHLSHGRINIGADLAHHVVGILRGPSTGALRSIVEHYEARSELYVNDHECASNLYDIARKALLTGGTGDG